MNVLKTGFSCSFELIYMAQLKIIVRGEKLLEHLTFIKVISKVVSTKKSVL